MNFFDSECLEEAVKEGIWAKIAESVILKKLISSITSKDSIESLSILGVLILDLNHVIERINFQAAQYEEAKQAPSKTKDEPNQVLKAIKTLEEHFD